MDELTYDDIRDGDEWINDEVEDFFKQVDGGNEEDNLADEFEVNFSKIKKRRKRISKEDEVYRR